MTNIETGTSQRDLKLIIPANGVLNPNAQGDFIFVKDAAVAVHVFLHDQEIEMERGDVRKVTRPFEKFTIENRTANDVAVRLVVGFGDYNRLIVQGEMNVSAYVRSSGNGISAALPDRITKEIGLDNNNEVELFAGTVVTDSPAVTYAGAVFLWDDEFYAVDSSNLYRLDKVNDGVFADTVALSSGLPGHARGAAVNTRGEIFVSTEHEIYKIAFDGTNFGSVANMGGTSFGGGGGSLGDVVYFSDYYTDAYGIFEYNTITGDTRLVKDAVNNGQMLGVRDGVLYRLAYGGGGGHAVDPVTLEIDPDETAIFVGAQRQTAFSPMDDLAATGNQGASSTFSVRNASDITHYGKIWVQEVGDPTTRRYLALLEEYIWYPRNGKTVMVGQVLKAIMASIERNYSSDYLDRVVSITYSDGLNTHLISSGTQSWALRGLEDEIHLALDSQVIIELLPPF